MWSPVKPAPLDRLRRLLCFLRADMWAPGWVVRYMAGDSGQHELFARVGRSIIASPHRWVRNAAGLTNAKERIGLFTRDGIASVAVAVDADKQFYPTPYWRWMLYRAAMLHDEQMAELEADTVAERIAA